MRNPNKDDFAFGKQIAVEVILRELIKTELNRLPTDAERRAKAVELRRRSEKALADTLADNLDPVSDTFKDADTGGSEVFDAVFGASPAP